MTQGGGEKKGKRGLFLSSALLQVGFPIPKIIGEWLSYLQKEKKKRGNANHKETPQS